MSTDENHVKCARCAATPHWRDAIRCAECKAYFCEAPCLMDHFASSGDDFKLGGLRAQKHMASIMSWLAEVEELRRVLLRISNAHIIKTMGGDIVDAEVCQWAADALCRPMGTTPGTAEPPATKEQHCEWCEKPITWLFIPVEVRHFSTYGTRASCDEHKAKTLKLTRIDGVACRVSKAEPPRESKGMVER